MADPRPSTADKRRAFRELHARGCFVIPNPWDVGTARYLQGLGFKALASTSAGYAFAQGLPDGAVSRDMMLAHLRDLASATDVPVNADFEGGYADEPDGVAESVRLCVATGVAGLSIEDSTTGSQPLYEFDLAVKRVRAARAAIDAAGGEVFFTGRSEGFIRGRPDLDETIRRLTAYAEAGADCLYAPGIKTREEIAAVVKAVAPKPVNFLMFSATTNFSVADLAGLGVRRISVGGTLARTAWTAFTRSAREIAEQGRFDSFNGMMSNPELNAFFAADLAKRT
jgi:2-methylisocitrate lyase-like PEP mutase family enzyme